MSGETSDRVSGWTVDTLKEYIEQRFKDQDKAVQAALLAAKEAVLKAETASEKRFESVNEFRGQLSDQTSTLMPRAESDTRYAAISEKVSDLTDRMNLMSGKSTGINAGWGYLAGVIGIIGTIVGIILALSK